MSANKPERNEYNLLTELHTAQETIGQYILGGVLMVDKNALERAASACINALDALRSSQALLMTRDWDEPTCMEVAKVFTECGVAIRAKNDDAGLTSVELIQKYAAGEGGEHGVFTANDWQAAVWESHTRAGYWDWVVEQIASHSVQDLRLEN